MFDETPVLVADQHGEEALVDVGLRHRQPPATVGDGERSEQPSVPVEDHRRCRDLCWRGEGRKSRLHVADDEEPATATAAASPTKQDTIPPAMPNRRRFAPLGAATIPRPLRGRDGERVSPNLAAANADDSEAGEVADDPSLAPLGSAPPRQASLSPPQGGRWASFTDGAPFHRPRSSRSTASGRRPRPCRYRSVPAAPDDTCPRPSPPAGRTSPATPRASNRRR